MENHRADTVKLFKAFCKENRLRILEILRTGEKCVCVLLEDLKISRPALSNHMKILCESRVVVGRRKGRWTYYTISSAGAETVHSLLIKLTYTFSI